VKNKIPLLIDKCAVCKHLVRGIISTDKNTSIPINCLSFRINKKQIYNPPSVFSNGLSYEFYFKFPIPLTLNDTVEIINSSNGQLLHSIYIDCNYNDSILPTASLLFSLPDWSIDNVKIIKNVIKIDGWILKKDPSTSYIICVNNQMMEVISTYDRKDLNQIFGNLGPLNFSYGFSAMISVPKLDQQQGLKFELRQSINSKKIITHSFYYPSSSTIKEYPLPSAEQIHRVYGVNRIGQYIKNGYTNFQKVKNIMTSLLPIKPQNKLRILDWGCGCAGIGRYFINDSAFDYFGCDIDSVNIDWCKEKISSKSFTKVLPIPPTPYQNGQFDVIVGISVFSHLNNKNQFQWLKELHRILKPEGFLIVSILGLRPIAQQQISNCLHIIENGFTFNASFHEIGEIIEDQGYYGTALHTVDYVLENWTNPFILQEYRLGYLGHQDIVVLKKRKD